MTFNVRTTVFEGPLDLLFQLITKRQVEITAIGLTEVVEEYLLFLDEMQEMDIEVTSEFLLIAATLVRLKAQALLPSDAGLDLDDELASAEERDRLLSRLLAGLTFKDAAAALMRRLEKGRPLVPRTSGLDQRIEAPAPEVTIPLSAEGVAALAGRVFARETQAPDLDHFDFDLPSVGLAIDDLRSKVALAVVAGFDELTGHCTRPAEVAAYFLALLEAARRGLVEVSQQDWLSRIEVRSAESAPLESVPGPAS